METAPAVSGEPTRLIVIGGSARRRAIERALGSLAVDIERLEAVPGDIAPDTLGLLLVAPLPGRSSPSRTIEGLRAARATRDLPLFVIAEDRTSDATVRKLYAAGATAVLHWPREALLLAPLMAELLGITLVRGRAKKPRAALQRTLQAHLRLIPWFDQQVRATAASDGTVALSGPVASLRRKQELIRAVRRIPGVRGTETGELWVAPSSLSDRQVAAAARSILRVTASVDDATVSVSVHAGVVTVVGTTSDRAEARRIVDLLTQVNGVREIRDSLVVSRRAKRIDRNNARRLQESVRQTFRERPLRVAAFGDVAVVTGKVYTLARKSEIERFVERDPAVGRVVNKLEVR